MKLYTDLISSTGVSGENLYARRVLLKAGYVCCTSPAKKHNKRLASHNAACNHVSSQISGMTPPCHEPVPDFHRPAATNQLHGHQHADLAKGFFSYPLIVFSICKGAPVVFVGLKYCFHHAGGC